MECKSMRAAADGSAITELIDTLWNVNPDTLKPVCSAILRINRYIMECKFKQCDSNRNTCGELIDTLWNVNVL